MGRLRSRSSPQARAKVDRRDENGSTQRRSSNKRPPELKPVSVDMCTQGIKAMQGDWVDEKGELYTLENRCVKQGHSWKWVLHLDRGFIDWGDDGKYFAVPNEDMDIEVQWLCAISKQPAWKWTRPASGDGHGNVIDLDD